MAGAGYKLFSTGDVLSASDVNLYLQQQTVMVFASAAARTTALSSVLAEGMVSYLKDTDVVEIYTGAAWVSLDDPNAIQNTIVTAKGDIIGASAASTPARLAVGNNGETLVADSSATTGLRYSATPSASNPIINAAMQVWQRGTSISLAASTAYTSGFLSDRWQTATGANQACTITRQATGDTTNLPNIQYALRYQRNSGQTGTGTLALVQNMESINSIPFAGKTVTMSYYARAGANFSSSSNILGTQLVSGTGTDQTLFTNYTGAANVISQNATLTTTWQRFSYTGTVAATATQLGVLFTIYPTGTAGAADYFEVTGVQIDIGSVALPFRTYAATIQGELAACQRYYYRLGGDALFQYLSNGAFTGANNGFALVNNPVSMRIAPSSVDFSTLQTYDYGAAYTLTNVTILSAGKLAVEIETTQVGSGTVYRPFIVRTGNSLSAYLGFSAEL